MAGHGKSNQAKKINAPATTGEDACADRTPVTLVKGAHRWSFACTEGDEPALLKRLSELAGGEGIPFDWFDAALVSHQLSKRLKAGLHRIDGRRPDASV